MAVPLKPWEVNMTGNIPNNSIPYVPNTNTGRLHSSQIPFPGSGGGGGGMLTSQLPTTSSSATPPLPPRSMNQTRPLYSAYNNNRSSTIMPYSSGYGSYNNSPYGLYSSPYSSYGGNSYGMNPYNVNRGVYGYGQGGQFGMGEVSFSQMAEESASPAFQSIESFVSAFCSISAMMESTFHALYSSFRAVIGVADHLGRVKQILSALTIFRFFKWVFRRFLYLVGISKIKPADVESLWNNLSSTAEATTGDPLELLQPNNKPSSWPILMFLGFIFAGPYLMWKLIKSLNVDSSQKDKLKWATGEREHFVAVAEYPFEPMSDRELELKPGQVIRLAPSKFQPADVKGWVLASDGVKIGLIPTNYIKIKGKKSRDTSSLLNQTPIFTPSNSVIISSPNNHHHHHKVKKISTVVDTTVASDAAGMSSSDDDTETLVGETIDED